MPNPLGLNACRFLVWVAVNPGRVPRWHNPRTIAKCVEQGAAAHCGQGYILLPEGKKLLEGVGRLPYI